jgi:hypothetical protein
MGRAANLDENLPMLPRICGYTARASLKVFSTIMTTRSRLISFAVVSNLAVIALCLSVSGWDEAGAGAATRNTARLAITFFLLGFASPGLQKWIEGWPEPSILLHMFVAAQFVHFGMVALLHTVFAKGGLQLGIPQVIVVLVGFSMVAGVGWTAIPHPGKRLRAAIHIVLLYLIFLFLVADYSQHPARPLRWMIVPLAIAIVLRHLPRKKMNSELTSSPA